MPPPNVRFEVAQPIRPAHILGRVLLVIGILASGLGAWHLWGTGILTAKDQARLAAQFEQRLLEFSDVTALDVGDGASETAAAIAVPVAWDDPALDFTAGSIPEPVALVQPAELLRESAPGIGEPLGRISIPAAEVDWVVVEGTSADNLRSGPGHISGTAIPGQVGNAVIAGHRTTNGAPFFHLDVLEAGDTITVETLIGTHNYEVVGTRIVQPTDTWVASQWEGSWLTLTTCTPRYSSQQRLIVFAQLVDGPNAEAIENEFGATDQIPLASGAAPWQRRLE